MHSTNCFTTFTGLRGIFETKKQTYDRRAWPLPYAAFHHQTGHPSNPWLHAIHLHVPQYDQGVQASGSVPDAPESCLSSSCQPLYLGRSPDLLETPMTCMVWKTRIKFYTVHTHMTIWKDISILYVKSVQRKIVGTEVKK